MLQSVNIASISVRDSNILAPSIPIQNTQAMPKRSHDVLPDLLNTTLEEPQQKRRDDQKTRADEKEHQRMVKRLAQGEGSE